MSRMFDETPLEQRYNLAGEPVERVLKAVVSGHLTMGDMVTIFRLDGWSPTFIEEKMRLVVETQEIQRRKAVTA